MLASRPRARHLVPAAAVLWALGGVSAPRAGAPDVTDLLRDGASWSASGWKLDGESRPALRVRYCCTGGGTVRRSLPVTGGQYEIVIRHSNTECREAVSARVVLEDGLTDGWRGPAPQVLATAKLEAGAEPASASLTFIADHLPGETVDLVLSAQGGLRCCGQTLIESVTMTAQPRTLPAPKLCRRCRQCTRRLREAKGQADAKDGSLGPATVFDIEGRLVNPDLPDDGSRGLVFRFSSEKPFLALSASVLWDLPPTWLDPRRYTVFNSSVCSPGGAPAPRKPDTKQPRQLWLQRGADEAFGVLAACASDPARLETFKQHFLPALDDCLRMKEP